MNGQKLGAPPKKPVLPPNFLRYEDALEDDGPPARVWLLYRMFPIMVVAACLAYVIIMAFAETQ